MAGIGLLLERREALGDGFDVFGFSPGCESGQVHVLQCFLCFVDFDLARGEADLVEVEL